MDFKIGDTLETKIETVAFGGDGVGRVDNVVVFVPFTVDGDVVEAEVTGVSKSYLRGEIKKLLVSSPHRIEPRCLDFARCGGCQYQHISYEHQLEIKEKQVAESFERIGKLEVPALEEIIPSPESFGYRGKAEYHVSYTGGKKPEIGFIDIGGEHILPLDRCELMEESINEQARSLLDDMVKKRRKVFKERQIIWSRPSDDEKVHRTPEHITREVKGKKLIVPYEGFFQANIFLLDTFVDRVIEMGGLSGSETVLDCYCGSGLFSFFLAGSARQVFSIDLNGKLARCAWLNYKNYGISNATVFKGDAKDILRDKFIERGINIDAVFLDPPRIGCSRGVLSGIADLKPKKVIYVSCNPATQARDIRFLADNGFSLKTLQPIDMFPQTKHIEVIASLERS